MMSSYLYSSNPPLPVLNLLFSIYKCVLSLFKQDKYKRYLLFTNIKTNNVNLRSKQFNNSNKK